MNIKSMLIKLLTPVSRIYYKNFNWVVAWELTSVCNLKCDYCQVEQQQKHPDVENISRKIQKLNPKCLIITGGEPLLIPDLENILENIKKTTDAYIILNHNGTMPEKLVAVLPLIDEAVISIDGLGEINKISRGVDGTKVFNCIKECVTRINKQNLDTRVTTNSVITNKNFNHFASLATELNELSPHIQIDSTPVEPHTHPLSVANNAGNYESFLGIIESLQRKNLNVRVTGPFTDSGKREMVHCYRQYFRLLITPEGDFVTCKPFIFAGHYYRELKKAFSKPDFFGCVSILKNAFLSLVVRRYGSFCPVPCNCEEYIDKILMARSFNELPKEYSLWVAKLDENDRKNAYDFILKHINEKFNHELLDSSKVKTSRQ